MQAAKRLVLACVSILPAEHGLNVNNVVRSHLPLERTKPLLYSPSSPCVCPQAQAGEPDDDLDDLPEVIEVIESEDDDQDADQDANMSEEEMQDGPSPAAAADFAEMLSIYVFAAVPANTSS